MTMKLILLVAALLQAPSLPLEPPPQTQVEPPTREELIKAVVEMVYQECQKKPCVPSIGLIGPIMSIDGDILDTFITAAQGAGAKAVLVSISSPGGMLGAAEKIVDALETSKIPSYCVVGSGAASAAFWVLQACTHRYTLPQAKLMIHEPYFMATMVNPGAKMTIGDMEGLLANIKVGYERIVKTCAPRLNLTPEAFKSKLAEGDWWLTASEALRNKAVDALVIDLISLERTIKAQYKVPPQDAPKGSTAK